MSKWVDRISNHKAITRLRKLAETLDGVKLPKEAPTETVEAFERLIAVARYALAVTSSVDPLLVPPQTLANFITPIQEIESQLSVYQSSSNEQALDIANNHADALLVALAALRQVASPEEASHVREAVTTLRKSVSQLKHSVEEERRQVVTGLVSARKNLDETKADISSQKARLDSAIATFQEQFSKAEDERRNQFSQSQSSREERIQVLEREAAGFQTKASEEIQASLAEIPTLADDAIKQALATTEAESEKLIAAIRRHEARAQELVFLTANTTTVGSYKLVADKQRREALIWRIVAAVSFVGLIGFAVWAFLHASGVPNEANWLSVSGRFFAALTFGLLGAFAAREASRFAQLEDRNRRTELALAALGPFLQDLPDELKHSLREEVARGIFVENSQATARPETEPQGLKLPSEKQLELVEKALETAQKMIEKFK